MACGVPAVDAATGQVDDGVGAVDLACPLTDGAAVPGDDSPGVTGDRLPAGLAREHDDLVPVAMKCPREHTSDVARPAGKHHLHDRLSATILCMRTVEISQPGPPEVLRLTDRPAPMPQPGEVLIAVAAAGVNRPDLMQRLGQYPPPPGSTDIPGLEVAGRIAAVGPDDAQGAPRSASGRVWREGDRVCALVAGGGYAELCVAPGVQCLPIPDGLSDVEAAAIPETYFTVWTNVFDRGR